MINAHFKPSDQIIQRIDNLVKGYVLEGKNDPAKYGMARYSICIEIAKEAGIENPTVNDITGCLPVFNYHASAFFDKYLEEKYNSLNSREADYYGDRTE